MRSILGSVLLGIALAAGAACSDSSSPTAPTNGGTGATGSTGGGSGSNASGSGGPPTSGGTGQSTSGSGGQPASGSGTGSSGGLTGGSGSTPASMDSSAPETSGPGDASPTNDAAVLGDAGRPPKPSVGCGKMNPPMGNRTIMTSGQQANFYVNLPTAYNATTPMPLGLGFHGFGNPLCLPSLGGECQGFPQLNAVTVYMKSVQAGWEGTPEPLATNLKFFEDVVSLMENEYCVDENRIFVAGVSSGGQFVEYLACRYGDWLWQVTPVSAF